VSGYCLPPTQQFPAIAVVRSLQDHIAFIINIYQHNKFFHSLSFLPLKKFRIYENIKIGRNETREKIINTLEYRNNPKVTERRSNSEMNVYA
jgi:hypothetical protein